MSRTGCVPLLERWEQAALDAQFDLRGPVAPGEDVVLLAFDDATIARRPVLFERRAGWAEVLDVLAAARPKVVGIDALFTDPERLLSDELVAALRDHRTKVGAQDVPAERLIDRVIAETRGDDVLAEAVGRLSNVVLGFHAGREGNEQAPAGLGASTYGQVVAGGGLPVRSRTVTSLVPLQQAAAGLGLVTVVEGEDGRVRSVPAGRQVAGQAVMPFSVALAARARGLSRAEVAWLGPDEQIALGERRIPAHKARVWLNWRGPAGTFRTVSVLDLLEGRVSPQTLTDKVVILGMTHLAQDRVTTSFGSRVPGIELHATAVDNLLDGDVLVRNPAGLDALLCLLVCLAVAGCFLLPWGPVARTGLAAVLLLPAPVFAAWMFRSATVWWGAAAPLWGGGVTMLLCLAAAYFVEGQQRRMLRGAFAHYLSEDVIAQMLREPHRIGLSGERRELSVLFTDVRGFTTLAEHADPLDIAQFLNETFTPLTEAVLENRGFLDKYIGDAIMAVFGAPLPRAEHAEDACRAALAMHRALSTMTAPGPDGTRQPLQMGVGINTGDMVVGNLGAEARFDYTVVGDAVNLASRIESLTKTYGVFCLVGEATQKHCGPAFRFREVDRVTVKGKQEPTAIFELLGGPGHDIVPPDKE